MVHAGALSLEERVSSGEKSEVENPFPALTSFLREFLLDTFSPRRHLRQKIKQYEQQGRYLDAAACAIKQRDYQHALVFYDRAAERGERNAYIYAAELAESLGDYTRGEKYRLNAGDLEYAGEDALRCGHHDEALRYWRKLAHGES